ncbi:protein of unknown function (plasmid) [Cupriavidus neocaledonicus]|uniref:Uncharacterized protein n=1 Tax=Cupriavidus neocaledonicus TaxID=1040979 RepID=A0A375HNG1_9BURK|nr:hypothetical protein CBM2605_B110114 [Cupriavidus neocaledonicus]SPD59769.1 protein of unknown function [Cupriavidus neocaledonicus]
MHAGRQQAGQHRDAQHARLEDQHEVIALPGARQLGPGFLIHRGFADIAADIEDKDRRQHAGPEQHAPCVLLVERGIDCPEGNRRQAPADGPAALHQTHGLAAMACTDHLGDQYRTDRPFAAKPEPLQHAGHEQLLRRLGESAQEGKEAEPEHGQLQDPHAAVFVGQDAGQPAADGRADKRARGDVASLGLGHAPHQDEGGNHEGVDHVVECIDAIADEGGKERLALCPSCFFKPHGLRSLKGIKRVQGSSSRRHDDVPVASGNANQRRRSPALFSKIHAVLIYMHVSLNHLENIVQQSVDSIDRGIHLSQRRRHGWRQTCAYCSTRCANIPAQGHAGTSRLHSSQHDHQY